jgi:hypothetical protein
MPAACVWEKMISHITKVVFCRHVDEVCLL